MYDDGISAMDPTHVQGEMTVGPNMRNQANLGDAEFSTLDEPIKETIVCQLFDLFIELSHL